MHCYTLQHTATHCNTLQHRPEILIEFAKLKCYTLQHTATHCSTPQHRPELLMIIAKVKYNTLQHVASHRNTLLHAATQTRNVHYNRQIEVRTSRNIQDLIPTISQKSAL